MSESNTKHTHQKKKKKKKVYAIMLTCLEYVHRLQHFFVSLFLLLFLNFDQLFKPNPTCTHAPLTLLPTWLFPTREKRILTDQTFFSL